MSTGVRLLAINDLHVANPRNRELVASLRSDSSADWLIVADDVAELVADVAWAFGVLAERLAKVIWVPGNHEPWTMPRRFAWCGARVRLTEQPLRVLRLRRRRDMLAELLPAPVHAVEVFNDPPDARLFPEEEVYVARAVEVRRREFTTGRHCAREALRRLGRPPAAIVRGERGAPGWPEGVVGSITHCASHRAAAVAHASDLVTIAIDAEPNQPLPAGVLEMVALPREQAMLATLAESVPGVAWDRLLFSAKESVYNAWAPLTGAFLDFDGAEVAFDPAAGAFVARLRKPVRASSATREASSRAGSRSAVAWS